MSDTEPIYLYGNDDRQRGVLQGVAQHVYAFTVNGAHTLSVSTTTRVSKEDRLVTMGEDGKWQEFVVIDPEDDDSSAVVKLTCERSEEELAGAYIESRRPTGDPATMLGYAFEYADPLPRWEIGDVEVTGPEKTQVWYHTNAREVMTRLQSTWGGEFEFEVVVEGAAIVRRIVHWRKRIGSARGKRFSYGKNLAGISRSRGTNRIYTKVYGYGAGLAVYDDSGEETGGYSRRITFGDVNGGRDYVESDEARLRWGRPDGKGGRVHVVGKVEFEDEQDQAELLRRTTEWAEAQYEPQVTYTAKVADFERAGSWGGPTCEGDDVTVDDDMMDPPLLATDRVVSGSVDRLCPEKTTYTIGKVPAVLSQTLEQQYQFQKDIGDRAPGWDSTADTVETMPGAWLQQQMDRLNQEFNNAGYCYKYTSLEKGDIWSTVPLDEKGRPTKTPASAINLCGLGFRIANKVKDGDFDWTTFGTGDGFTANCINVGILRCGDNYLNLDTGEMRIALNAKLGSDSTTVSGYVSNAANDARNDAIRQANANTEMYLEDYVEIGNFSNYLTMQNTFNALTNNGRNKGFFIQNGQVLISADAIQTGMILSTDGRSGWDLDNGYFETASSGWSGGQFHGIATRLYHGSLGFRMDVTDVATLSTYSSGMVHPFGIKVLTDLVLGAPGGIGVSHNSTQDSGLTYRTGVQQTIGVVTGVSGGDSISVTRSNLSFDHGILVAATSNANATFSTPLVEHIALAACTKTMDDIGAAGAIPIERVTSTDQLMQAADEARPIWQMEPETLALGIPVYTGEEWTMGVPTEDPSYEIPEDVEIPTTQYVNAQAALVQSELEAIAAHIGDATLTRRLATARAAMANGGAAGIAKVAAQISTEER